MLTGSPEEAASVIAAKITDPSKRYIRRKRIGKGQFKEVFQAFDEEEALEVAWNEIDCTSRTIDMTKVRREIGLLHDLDHENVLRFHTSWMDEERRCFIFITELMTSGTLKDFIAMGSRLKPHIVRRWCRQILSGLQYLHSLNIMHRDLKCDNIFINGNKGEIKIGDLGLSVAGVSQARTVTGTPEFMAPEIYEEQYTNSVDIWSFGNCVVEMVTGEYPYSECQNVGQVYRKVSMGVLPLALQKVDDVQCKEMIELCLQTDPAKRPTAQQLLDSPFFQEEGTDSESKIDLAAVFVDLSSDDTAPPESAPETPLLARPPPSQRDIEAFLSWASHSPKVLRLAVLQLGAASGIVPPAQFAELESQARHVQQAAIALHGNPTGVAHFHPDVYRAEWVSTAFGLAPPMAPNPTTSQEKEVTAQSLIVLHSGSPEIHIPEVAHDSRVMKAKESEQRILDSLERFTHAPPCILATSVPNHAHPVHMNTGVLSEEMRLHDFDPLFPSHSYSNLHHNKDSPGNHVMGKNTSPQSIPHNSKINRSASFCGVLSNGNRNGATQSAKVDVFSSLLS